MAFEEQMRQTEEIGGDRRHDRRYDLHLEVRWKLIRRKRVLEAGTGRTLDLSSGGILFETDRPLPIGLNVELSVAWPVMLHNVAPMQLVIAGRIVRSVGEKTAAQMVQHEFRTLGTVDHKKVQAIASRPATNLNGNNPFLFSRAN